MNFELNQQVLLIIALAVILFYFMRNDDVEGYGRPVVGGSYGPVQNEIFWYPYPHQPTIENPGTRHAKYSPRHKVHAVSYVHPDFNTTVNEAHGCTDMTCPPAFAGEDVKCYGCPQRKGMDSGR